MIPINKKDVKKYFGNFWAISKDDKFCPCCFHWLKQTGEGDFWCSNDMCLNEEIYDKDGKMIRRKLF